MSQDSAPPEPTATSQSPLALWAESLTAEVKQFIVSGNNAEGFQGLLKLFLIAQNNALRVAVYACIVSMLH